MESPGQNYVVSGQSSSTELYPTWGTDIFNSNLAITDVEEFNYADLQFAELFLSEESSNQSSYEFAGIDRNNSEVHENGAVVVLRPVVPPTESIGVTYHKKNKQWEAHLWLKGQQLRNKRKKRGVQLFLGTFPTVDEAKQAHDRAAIKMDVQETARGKAYPLNFPESVYAGYIAEHSTWSARDFLWKLRRSSPKFNKGKSRMKGVSLRRGRNGGALFEAKISLSSLDGDNCKRTFDLGKFASEDEAGMAYDRALLFLKGADELTCITNFRPSCYSASEIQEAGSRLLS